MKNRLLLLSVLMSALSSGVLHAYTQDAYWTSVEGYVVGFHYTQLAGNETGPSSSAFINADAYFTNVNCPSKSSGLLTHPDAVGWMYAACPGSNTSTAQHYAIIHNYPTTAGFTSLNRVW